MKLTTAQIEWDGFRVIGIPVDHVLHVTPEPNYPAGRKALHMSELWERVRTYPTPGILWIDPDIAADPDDLAAMAEAVEASPEDMHTGLVKLWPASTGWDHWIWSHRGGTLGQPAATQEVHPMVAYIATGFLWTPSRLLDLVFPRIKHGLFHEVDVALSEAALQAGIPARTVLGCQPKHLHFSREHHGYVIPGRT